MPPFVRQRPSGVDIDVLVQPRASRSRLLGPHDGRMKIQLAAPPVDGAANDALTRLLARLLGVAAGRVSVVRGETSRRKTVAVEGVSVQQVDEAFGKGQP